MDERDELRRLAEDASRAARAAEEAATRMEREQPSRFESILRTITSLLQTLFDGVLGRLRSEIDNARRSGEELVARVLRALSRSLRHLGAALAWGAVMLLALAIGLVVLTVGLVVWLNGVLGDPAGTFVTALLFLAAAGIASLVARARFRRIADEADALAPSWRR